MTLPKEIILANMAWEGEERIGLNFVNEPDRFNDMREIWLTPPAQPEPWREDQFEHYYDVWGNEWRRIHSMSAKGEVHRGILEDWSNLENLELPALDGSECFEKAYQKTITEKERFCIGIMPGWVFEIARYMRRMENYFVDLCAEQERLEILHSRITDLLEGVIDQFGKIGVDGIMFCEDLGVQDKPLIGPDMWNAIFRHHYERLTAKAHKNGMKVIMHSCGYNWALVDGLCQSGIDCFQFDQPNIYDQPALAEKLRHYKVALFSPCDIQKVLPTGDQALIETETAHLTGNFKGGFIAKDYPDLHGIGVELEWDRWAYQTFLDEGCS